MTTLKRISGRTTLSAALIACLSAACNTGAPPSPSAVSSAASPAATEPPANPAVPAIRGTVTSVLALRAGDRVAVIVVEENPNQPSGSGKDAITIDQRTEVFRATATRLVVTDWSEITEGTRLEAWYRGAVSESYPRQATASRLVILEQQ